MGALALLALLSGAVMISTLDSDDDAVDSDDVLNSDDVVNSDETDEADDSEEMLDTGASFEQTEDGVIIDVGEDETRSVVAVHFRDTQDNPDDFVKTDEVRYYLAPEETDWSDASWETRSDVPGQDTFDDPDDGTYTAYTLEEFEASQGLELIGVVDVKGIPSETGDPDDRVGEVTSNVPIESFYLEAETDGDQLYSFLPEDYVVTRFGVAQESVTQSTTGTDETDWLSADADDIALFGAAGDDILETSNANVTLNGGDGDDTLEASGTDVVLEGGDGDDQVRTVPTIVTEGIPVAGSSVVDLGAGDDRANVLNSTVYGGTGNDYITGISNEEETLLYGETGNDRVIASGAAATAYGGSGNDFVAANNGATGYGGDGNDHIQLDAGTIGYGGAGDDLFTVWNQFRDEDGPATITTGEGADTIDARVWNAFNGEADDIYLRVTDFNTSEDVLEVGVFQTGNDVDEVEIVESDDGSHTDVRVTYTGQYSLAPGIAIIRLEGTTGLSADQIVIT